MPPTPASIRTRWLLAFLAALLVGTVLGSLVQTQFNLLAIQSMGFPVSLGVRLSTSVQDLVFFGPVFAAVFGSSFLVSQVVALTLNRWLAVPWHPLVCALGAATGLGVTLQLVDAMAPMPTLIAASRSLSGTVALLACAALAGWLLARWRPQRSRPAQTASGAVLTSLVGALALGHRNVQGLFFDADSKTLFSHEHGPKGGDEINALAPGENYGWPAVTHGVDYTGARVSPYTEWPGIRPPLWQWTPSIAPSGLTRYTGSLFPDWQGDLLVGALASKQVHRLKVSGRKLQEVAPLFTELNARIRDVRTGPEGAIYLLTDSAEGQLLRVVPDR